MIDIADWLDARAADWQEDVDRIRAITPTKLVEAAVEQMAEAARVYRCLAAALRALEERSQQRHELACVGNWDCCTNGPCERDRAVIDLAEKLRPSEPEGEKS